MYTRPALKLILSRSQNSPALAEFYASTTGLDAAPTRAIDPSRYALQPPAESSPEAWREALQRADAALEYAEARRGTLEVERKMGGEYALDVLA